MMEVICACQTLLNRPDPACILAQLCRHCYLVPVSWITRFLPTNPFSSKKLETIISRLPLSHTFDRGNAGMPCLSFRPGPLMALVAPRTPPFCFLLETRIAPKMAQQGTRGKCQGDVQGFVRFLWIGLCKLYLFGTQVGTPPRSVCSCIWNSLDSLAGRLEFKPDGA